MLKTITKKDGTLQEWNPQKIIDAVKKSAERVMQTLTDYDLDNITKFVKDKAEQTVRERNSSTIYVNEVHNIVEMALDRINPNIAKSYRDYRDYKTSFVGMLDEVYRKSQSIMYIGDKENSNTDSALVSTKRSLIFNQLNKELYKKFFLTVEELQACREGYIYVHDMSARRDTMNCCLFDMENVLKGGFEMGNLWYNEPKSLDTAFDVIGDVVLSAASQQYGGFTVPSIDLLLEPYAELSYKKYVKYFKDEFDASDEKAEAAALKQVQRDFEQGFQGWEYKFNSVSSSRGDYPFITMSFGTGRGKFAKMASITFLRTRMIGQGKEGFKKPVLFPKLVFLYDENLHGPGKELEDVFEAGVECSAKAMYPDWLSLTGEGYVPSMYKKYGEIISPMGCRAFLSPWYKKGGLEPADENDKPVFIGRFNIGAISLHLPMILAKARKESRDFHEVLDYYLEMIRKIHLRTYEYLGNMRASTNPLAYCEGGFLGGHLGIHDKIKPLLKSATASFGITALNELQQLYNGKSLVEDGEFALETLKYGSYSWTDAQGRVHSAPTINDMLATQQAVRAGYPASVTDGKSNRNSDSNARIPVGGSNGGINPILRSANGTYHWTDPNGGTWTSNSLGDMQTTRASVLNGMSHGEPGGLGDLKNANMSEHASRLFNPNGTPKMGATTIDSQGREILRGGSDNDIANRIANISTPEAMNTGAGVDGASAIKAATIASRGVGAAQALMNANVNGGIQDDRVTAATYEQLFGDGTKPNPNGIDSVVPGLSQSVAASVGEYTDGSGDVSDLRMNNGEITGQYIPADNGSGVEQQAQGFSIRNQSSYDALPDAQKFGYQAFKGADGNTYFVKSGANIPQPDASESALGGKMDVQQPIPSSAPTTNITAPESENTPQVSQTPETPSSLSSLKNIAGTDKKVDTPVISGAHIQPGVEQGRIKSQEGVEQDSVTGPSATGSITNGANIPTPDAIKKPDTVSGISADNGETIKGPSATGSIANGGGIPVNGGQITSPVSVEPTIQQEASLPNGGANTVNMNVGAKIPTVSGGIQQSGSMDNGMKTPISGAEPNVNIPSATGNIGGGNSPVIPSGSGTPVSSGIPSATGNVESESVPSAGKVISPSQPGANVNPGTGTSPVATGSGVPEISSESVPAADGSSSVIEGASEVKAPGSSGGVSESANITPTTVIPSENGGGVEVYSAGVTSEVSSIPVEPVTGAEMTPTENMQVSGGDSVIVSGESIEEGSAIASEPEMMSSAAAPSGGSYVEPSRVGENSIPSVNEIPAQNNTVLPNNSGMAVHEGDRGPGAKLEASGNDNVQVSPAMPSGAPNVGSVPPTTVSAGGNQFSTAGTTAKVETITQPKVGGANGQQAVGNQGKANQVGSVNGPNASGSTPKVTSSPTNQNKGGKLGQSRRHGRR